MSTPEETQKNTPAYYYYDSATEGWKATSIEELKGFAKADTYVCQQLPGGEFSPAITYAELEKQLLPPTPALPPIPKASVPQPRRQLRTNIESGSCLSKGEIRPGIETSRMSRKDFISKWKEWIRNNKFWLIAQVVVLLLFIATIIPACIYEEWELLIFALLLIPAKIGIAIKLFISGLRYQKFYKMRCHDLGYSMGHYIGALVAIPIFTTVADIIKVDDLDRANAHLDQQIAHLENLEREQNSIESSALQKLERLNDRLDNGSISESQYIRERDAIVMDYENRMESIENRLFSPRRSTKDAEVIEGETTRNIIAILLTLGAFGPLTYIILRLFFKEGSKAPNKYGPAPTVPYSEPK